MMPAASNTLAFTLRDAQDVVSGDFLFSPNLPVSKTSCFGDGVWDWTYDHFDGVKRLNPNKLRINWDKVTIGTQICLEAVNKTAKNKIKCTSKVKFISILPLEFVEDIKRTMFLSAACPPSSFNNHKNKIKPITIVSHTRHAIRFFSHIYLSNIATAKPKIKWLSDITLRDIKQAIATYPYEKGNGLRKSLSLFCLENIGKNLKYGSPQWTRFDLKNIKWDQRAETTSIETLPNELFAFLSNKSSDIVGSFLRALGVKPSDSSAGYEAGEAIKLKWPLFKEMFESYVSRRMISRIKGSSWTGNHTRAFFKKFNIPVGEVRAYLFDVQSAAQALILLYTGMRYSEAVGLQKGCLVKRDHLCFIKSSVEKGRPNNFPREEDEWVAIDIVQDAVRVLEELSRCNFNRFLFSNYEVVKQEKAENPVTNAGLVLRFTEFLVKLDDKKKWGYWELSLHQFRHGLAYQLARAEVSLPYITRQLKHIHNVLSQISNKVNATTIGYGRQKEHLLGTLIGADALYEARFEVISDLYGEGWQFAGGGAAQHVERTEAFFRGHGVEGEARKEYLSQLAESDIAVIRTGVGWCTRNHVDPKKFKEEPPPCVGDLNCKPHTCKHSVVPKSHKSEIVERYKHAIRQLKSDDQFHLRKHWTAQRDAWGAMLKDLGFEIDESLESRD